MKSILKMTWRLIRKTPGRFISLLAIVLLGTAFYIGVSAVSMVMSTSVNRYDDLLNLKDITVYSNYGFDQADIDAVKSLDSVADAEGSSFVDVYSVYGDSSSVTRIHSWSPDAKINRFVLRSGRLPKRKDEVLADNGTVLLPGYKPGTQLTLVRPENDLSDTLSVDHVTVVGTIDTPLYLNETREASTLSNLYIQTFLYIPEEAFCTDYFSEMNVLIKDGKTFDEFSDEYRTYSQGVKEDIKAFAAVQKDKRPDRIKADAMKEYNDGLSEYEDGLSEYETAVADAEKQIRDAENELSSGWDEVRNGQQSLNDAQAELDKAREDYTAQINEGIQKLADGRKELEKGKKEFAEKKKEYSALRKQLSDTLDQLNKPPAARDMTLEEAMEKVPEDMKEDVQAIFDELGIDPSAVSVEDILNLLKQSVTPASVSEMNMLIDQAMTKTEETVIVKEDGELPFEPEPEPEPVEPEEETSQEPEEPSREPVAPEEIPETPLPQEEILPEEEADVTENGEVSEPALLPEEDQPEVPEPVMQSYVMESPVRTVLLDGDGNEPDSSPIKEVQIERPLPETLGDLAKLLGEDSEAFSFLSDLINDPDLPAEDAIAKIGEYADLVLTAEQLLEDAVSKPLPDDVTLGELALISPDAEKLKTELELSDETTLGEVRALLKKRIRQIDDGLAEGKAAIEDGEAELAKGEAELASAQAELNAKLADGQKAINDGWNQITDSISLLTDGRKTLNQSILDFEKEKTEGKQKLDEAKAELDDAYAQISSMEEAEWTVLDRSQHYSSETYRGTINQMAAIARIFPLFFIAVAALVCLTTMTRLVNEERGQIGILRALGYRPSQCSFVYLTYAGAAGILGCILGTIAGLSTFPIIIYNTWKMLYILPKMEMEIPWRLIVTASAVFIAMMLAVTESVLYRDMKDVPSVIMRPKSPKIGENILLEKVSVIWNRISFSWKVTIRNLARYKRRMLMTVIGVGGCTALLVTGFGISDSINNIVNIQFNEISFFDARITLAQDADGRTDPAGTTRALLAMDSTDAVYPAAEYSGMVSLDGEKEEVATVEVFPDRKTLAGVYNLRERVGHAPLSTQYRSVIISEKMAENLSVSVGDEILLESSNGEKVRVPVSGITEMYVYHYVMMTEDTYRALYHEVPETNTLFLRLKEGITADEEIKAAYAAADGVDSVNFVDFIIRNFQSMIEGIDGVVIVLIAASMGLAFVVLGNLTNVNISERMREIATLKVLGFRQKEVQNYIYQENNIMVALGALIGLPAGKCLSGYIMREVELTNVMFGRGVDPTTYIYAAVLTLLFGFVVNAVMRKKLNSVRMVESLKSVE